MVDALFPEKLGQRFAGDDPLFIEILDLWISRRAEATDRSLNDQLLKELVEQFAQAEQRLKTLLAETEAQRRRIAQQAEILEETVAARTRDLSISQNRLKILVDLGILLSSEKDPDELLRRIMIGGKTLSNADVATIYLRTPDDHLRFAVRSNTDELPAKKIPLFDPKTGAPNQAYVATQVANTGASVIIDDVYGEDHPGLIGARQFDAVTGYRTTSMMTVALKPREGAPLGVLQLINAIDPASGEVVPFDPALLEFLESLAAQAAVALDNLNLARSQEDLLESVIHITASAIDAKSPYTGGHCERVPLIGKMLAEAACAAREGPFADFDMTSDQWREFHFAGWLHDCGKVSTPESVVDKATKLETIFNRIHEIRTRFEVLRRDALIAYQEGLLTGKEAPEILAARRDRLLVELEEEFVFVAECNVGGEFMSRERIERLRRIGQRTWRRHFDDRLGLSLAELDRLEGASAPPLPAVERLLDDKPTQIVPRSVQPLSFDPEKWGFRIQAPECLYNYGELYNLSIERGTLTAEERFKINEHVINTIVMLERLPFPRNLSRVGEYAGAHHETMDGSGYPRRLTKAQMPLQARILAIADVFEALTAADRPYKKAKTLSEALRILHFMARDQHIDPDLFQLFLTSRIWERYAGTHLNPEQCDAVDITPFLSGQPESG